jgi:alkylhydroperoxidase family enzyme
MSYFSDFVVILAFLLTPQESVGVDQTSKVIPTSRPQMKKLLEELKTRTPRIPMPPRAEGETSVNNGHMRAFYLPRSWQAATPRSSPSLATSEKQEKGKSKSSGSSSDPKMTLDPTFKTRLFWIVSRANNCYYCMGHQELKLARAGMLDDAIASLDCDWERFPENEQAAFEFSRKLTVEPHKIGSADIRALLQYFTDDQVVEIVQTVSQYNATNRWTDSLGIPQDREFSNETAVIDTPTSDEFSNRISQVAPTYETVRPALESPTEFLSALELARNRRPNIDLPHSTETEKFLAEHVKGDTPVNWARALSIFPTLAARQIDTLHGMNNEGRLPTLTKAQIQWAVARENRAFYVAGHAMQRLKALGMTPEQIFLIDKNQVNTENEKAAVLFARKLTAHPRQIGDQDITELKRHFSDHEVAEIVFVTAYFTMLGHFTESLGLPLEN